jgi:hypothetical protein
LLEVSQIADRHKHNSIVQRPALVSFDYTYDLGTLLMKEIFGYATSASTHAVYLDAIYKILTLLASYLIRASVFIRFRAIIVNITRGIFTIICSHNQRPLKNDLPFFVLLSFLIRKVIAPSNTVAARDTKNICKQLLKVF